MKQQNQSRAQGDHIPTASISIGSFGDDVWCEKLVKNNVNMIENTRWKKLTSLRLIRRECLLE
jgi:hypothetical protein